MTLIRELIDIPTEVRRDAFVLKLTEGLAKADQTLKQYVVTPQLARAFDEALGFVAAAVDGGTSRAAYLHGSFGSGKSHFMAVLHLLLNGHVGARSVPRLQGPLGKHAQLLGRRFLMVPYHMVGASSLEQALFDGYVKHVSTLHPEAPPPAVYRTEELFANARSLRETLGDATFFEKLSAAGSEDEHGGWGDLDGWGPERFDAALRAAPGDEERQTLLQDLVATHFPAFKGYAAGNAEAMVGIDDGLAAMSQHARALGYDALVLFLDEVVLWLAARAVDNQDINQEAQKLAKLVESQNANRPAPIVAFLARQRKLSELVGEQMDGVERARLDASFAWNDGRFAELVLEDRNLPMIARERLLEPRDEDCKRTLDGAFERFARGPRQLIDRLMTSGHGLDDFRHIYPFTPALMQALVALSAALQRERTALRVMLMLLVEQRDRLRLDEIIPVGDLWDVIDRGAEPFSAELKNRFEAARRLYREKLKPLLTQTHGVDPDAPGEAASPARNDARLAKTLLLSALVPQVEALRGLDAHKLAALNHGTIRSPIPGQEAAAVLGRVKAWAGQVGEIRLTGDQANPSIHIELSDVDVDGLIEKVSYADTPGNRKRRVAELVFSAFRMQYGTDTVHTRNLVWRGTARAAEVIFTNVRKQDDHTLTVQGDGWRVLVDYPFDEDGFGPADDLARAHQFLEKHPQGSTTLLWLPRFFGPTLQRDLGVLVCIDHLVRPGGHFEQVAGHLSPEQRVDARAQLENRRSALENRVGAALAAAYGLQQAEQGVLDDAHAEHDQYFISLRPGFAPQKPGTGDLGKGLDLLLDQALRHQFPAHPEIDLRARDNAPVEVRKALARRVWGWCEKAAADTNRRVMVEKKERVEVKEVVEKLQLGTLSDGPLVLSTHWRDTLERCRLAAGLESPSVAQLREWIDPADRRSGLPDRLSDLIVLCYAAWTNRRFTLHGGPVDDKALQPGAIHRDLVLATLDLPEEAEWQRARTRAEQLFGVTANALCNAGNVARLAEALSEKLTALRGDAAATLRLLDLRLSCVGLAPRLWPRRDAAAALASLPDPRDLSARALIEAVARIPESEGEAAMVNEMGRLAAGLQALRRDAEWAVFEKVGQVRGPRAPQAASIVESLGQALMATEFAQPLGPVIDRLYPAALDVLTPVVDPPPPPTGWTVVAEGALGGVEVDWARLRSELEAALQGPGERRFSLSWTVERREK